MKVLIAVLFFGACLNGILADVYIGCEKEERIKLQCSDKTAPEIKSATWGRQDEAECPHPIKDDMSCSDDVTDKVKNLCNEKKCAFRANKRKLGDPCEGDGTPIIKIEYECPTEPPAYEEGQLRLFNGASDDEGIAQVYKNGTWGTICDIEFYNHGWPQVFCIELGYARAADSIYAKERDSSYEVSGPISLKSPACRPDNADNMAECRQDKNFECNHDLDVYVTCDREGQVRLFGGDSENEGIAQMYRNGTWGTICDIRFVNHGWPLVFCTELGYPSAESSVYAKQRDSSYEGSGPITFQSPACGPSSADNMAECGQDVNFECDHNKDVYVTCAPKN